MSSTTFSLNQILQLVGDLNDQTGENTPRDRFRRFLQESVTDLGTMRDYVDVCLREKGGVYDRALQDLVNHIGRLMGFDVEFGRYHGIANDIGHDGLWRTRDFSIVIEVKTTAAFAIQTNILLGYINALNDAGRIPGILATMGLYVFGKQIPEMSQLEASILQTGNAQRLRISTMDDLLSLADLQQQGLMTRDEIVALLRPVGVRVGATVQILKRIAAGIPPSDANIALVDIEPAPLITVPTDHEIQNSASDSAMCLLTPVAVEDDISAEETIRSLLDQGVYVFGDRTPGRKDLKPGDRIAFYESGKGVVACANVTSSAEHKQIKFAKDSDKYPWSFSVSNVRYFFNNPVVIDGGLRSQLEAFAGRDPYHSWSWLVQGTRKITEHDFNILTRHR